MMEEAACRAVGSTTRAWRTSEYLSQQVIISLSVMRFSLSAPASDNDEEEDEGEEERWCAALVFIVSFLFSFSFSFSFFSFSPFIHGDMSKVSSNCSICIERNCVVSFH